MIKVAGMRNIQQAYSKNKKENIWCVGTLGHAHKRITVCEIGALWVKKLWNRRVEHWAICSSICSFARTAHSFACSALLATLARQLRSFYRSLAPSLIPVLMGEDIMSTNWMRWFLTASTHIVMVYSRFLNKKLNRNKSSVVQTIRSRSDLYLFIILLL